MALLEASGVGKTYGAGSARNEVLTGINLAIEEGEFVAIIGYSGSGKTTLISLLAGLIAPDTGTIRLEGRKVDGPGPDRGLVFQNYSLLPWLTVLENVRLGVDQVMPEASAAERAERVEHFVRMVNLWPARDKRPGELSGGMRQRVSVARTLALNPRVLLLDEPLSALDALTRATLQDEIARLWSEHRTTVVLITNDPDEAILLADRVIPLTRAPRATLAASIPVPLPRPRHRRILQPSPEFKQLRSRVVDALLAAGTRPHSTVTRELVLPDIEPEDLSRLRPRLPGQLPRRRSERRQVSVQIEP